MSDITEPRIDVQAVFNRLKAKDRSTKRIFNISCRKVGGLYFLKLGRLTFMFCLSKQYRTLKSEW